jgi:hypothetical protein
MKSALFPMRCRAGKSDPGFHNKRAARDLLDSARDSQAVPFASDKRFQDQQV